MHAFIDNFQSLGVGRFKSFSKKTVNLSTYDQYADDLVLTAEPEEQLLEKVKRWKDGMEWKGF
jgi:hypothetical protein